ncbi:hypothetical protein I3843_03G262600 [Carya illinoinensis]|uniref:Uncharacterized protein n=1 Tax=Carya illinoinensis TaxID=32201 RepID=A0A8T1R9K7_CARIL|nr:uncharacterized protein LOC122305526 isoform X1 [Carya illinoinensis]KAG2719653.1 hypothetical protein I3760_03G275300 [Carya illinoinensis]KAG6663063.1 hypothetical protein CIPAW_03G284800 [Carya illinoinensis]KAG6724796.1 hypothetical protein I3842_03G273600 [Carya illinoinensis]KAG7989942.1 hypothetical protein I3843_03G262600 [Carya illinoinensis]
MFTEGLDESAIKWIKQGSDLHVEEPPPFRSPLTEKIALDPFPKSPLAYSYDGDSFVPVNILPPLKFQSCLLTTHSLVAPCLEEEDDESVASVADDDYTNYSEEEALGSNDDDIDFLDKPILQCYGDEQEITGHKPITSLSRGRVSSVNKVLSKENLRIEVSENFRRYTDGESGTRRSAQKDATLRDGGSEPRKRIQLCNLHGTRSHQWIQDLADLGTPSAPPIVDMGREEKGFEDVVGQTLRVSDSLIETDLPGKGICPNVGDVFNGSEGLTACRAQSLETNELGGREQNIIPDEKETHIPSLQTNVLHPSPHYSTSGQYAWQTLIAYDACIRLCLHAWGRGCTEAPEFLQDECVILRSAFGLHKFLLHPKGVQPMEVRTTKSVEQICSMNTEKVVGKIRVEVKKLRVIPRRKLKSTYSQRGAIYMQAGAEYVRHVSSLLKTGINSIKTASFSGTTEESFSCLFQLKSAKEDTEGGQGSAICLRPGSGDYHVFFPEIQGDALLVEVQDTKNSVQGRTTIPVSSLADNPSDRIRWWPIYHDDQECVGKIQLFVGCTVSNNDTNHTKSGPVVETLAYDLLLEAAMHAQEFHSRNLSLHGPWKWLLTEFADYYGVSNSYTKLRYLSHVMKVATPTKDCLELVSELLVPIIKARSEKTLTRQEKNLLLDCETKIESLLANVFENYKSLDEDSATGLADLFGSIQETAAPALAPAVQVYTLLHDILSLDTQTMLRTYFQTAAKWRCRKHMAETDEFMSSNSENFLMDSITISTAYLKMKNLFIKIGNEIQADIKIHDQHILPSSIDLSKVTAAVYSTELCNRLRGFLAAWPPSSPMLHVNELVIATADFERDLESWNISPVQGGVNSRNLFHNYIILWVQDMQLSLLELCKAEKVPWSEVMTNHSTSPFAVEMYEKIRDNLIQYEVVINRWPQYSLILESAVANVERAIIKALEKQYNDILTPLKDSIQKKLNMQVQKLTRRQSMTIYYVPNQLGIFLNTMKRILDVLHIRVEETLKSWASYLPTKGDKKSLFGEQMNTITVLLRTKYKNYLQALVEKLVSNMQSNRNTRLKRILEETKEEDGEAEVRERMQLLSSQLTGSISNLHEVFTSWIFIATCRGLWDRMGQIVLRFLEERKENRFWYNGSYYALVILEDTFASQMQRLQGNALQEKDLEPPRSVIEARSILCRDTANATDPSSLFYV